MKCNKCKQTIEGTPAICNTKYYCPGNCYEQAKDPKKYRAQIIREKNRKLKKIKNGIENEKKKKTYEKLKEEYNKIEEEINNYLHDKTLKRFKLLTEAYKIGSSLNSTFNHYKLAEDFKISIKHCKRILSLRNCTKYTKNQIKANKISANKVCIITFEKPKELQNKIVKWAVQTNATNKDIHEFRTGNEKSEEGIRNDYDKFKTYSNGIINMSERIKKHGSENLKQKIKVDLQELSEKIISTLNELESNVTLE